VAKLIGRAWRAQRGLKQTLRHRSQMVRNADESFAQRELGAGRYESEPSGASTPAEQPSGGIAAGKAVPAASGVAGRWKRLKTRKG
jgi:hypothetical protein